MVRFTLLFLLIMPALFLLELLQPVEQYVINPFTSLLATVSSFIVQLFDGDAASQGKMLYNSVTGVSVTIERGCNGVEAVIILLSAILAYPSPWKHKLIGFVIGFFAIQALNLVRIISLFYLIQWNQVWFEWFHLYLWQALIILDALVVWLIWLRWLPPPQRKGPPPSSGTPAPVAA
jgi:exosortase H (IPTLxxWG-CTERM-specific)